MQLPRRFSKQERLCKRSDIESLMRNGKRISNDGIALIWELVQDDRQVPAMVLFSAPKKKFKRAVDRNLIKRRMREAYRLNKAPLIEALTLADKKLNFAFIYQHTEIAIFAEVEKKIVILLKGLIKEHE